nr:MAG TPA: hypothetical protein [Caudoviricetes sp.]
MLTGSSLTLVCSRGVTYRQISRVSILYLPKAVPRILFYLGGKTLPFTLSGFRRAVDVCFRRHYGMSLLRTSHSSVWVFYY